MRRLATSHGVSVNMQIAPHRIRITSQVVRNRLTPKNAPIDFALAMRDECAAQTIHSLL